MDACPGMGWGASLMFGYLGVVAVFNVLGFLGGC